ncbi:MAG: porin family protein [Bacteroidaceae bacterium]
MKTRRFLGMAAACAAILACAPAAQAQSGDGEGITFGVRAGVNLSNAAMNDDAKGESDTKMKAGFNVGVIADIPVMQSLYVQPGLYFSTKGVKTEQEYTEDYGMGDVNYKDETSVNAMYIEIPINVSWRHNLTDALQLQVYTGPYFAFGVGGKTKSTESVSFGGESESKEYKTNTFGYDKDAENDEDEGYGLGRFDCG